MYGETFDEFPVPIDAFKYYSWLALVARALTSSGQAASCTVVVADDAVRTNKAMDWGEALIKQRCDQRVAEVEGFLQGCKGGEHVHVELMSEVRRSPSFIERRSQAETLLRTSSAFRDGIVSSVRPERRAAEETKGFSYSLDEAALVSSFELKVGPPREQYYDDAARVLASADGRPELVSVLLAPDYPLALSPGDFMRNDELATYGATPYKAGSHGWRKNRATPGVTPPTRLAA